MTESNCGASKQNTARSFRADTKDLGNNGTLFYYYNNNPKCFWIKVWNNSSFKITNFTFDW